MSSSSTPFASSTDLAFFSSSTSSTSGSSTYVTTRWIPVTFDHPSRAGAPTIKVTAQEAPRPIPPRPRKADAVHKRKSEDALTRPYSKRRRVSPSHDTRSAPETRASSAVPSPGSRRQTSLARSYLSPSYSSTRATSSTPSTRSSVGPLPGPPRECWIDEDGKPGPGFLSSEAVVQKLMKGYKACKSIFLVESSSAMSSPKHIFLRKVGLPYAPNFLQERECGQRGTHIRAEVSGTHILYPQRKCRDCVVNVLTAAHFQ